MDEKNILEQRITELEKLVGDLLEYLRRTDDNFQFDPLEFETWQIKLENLRNEERRRAEIASARAFLEKSGFLVMTDENEIDAQILKKWLAKGKHYTARKST